MIQVQARMLCPEWLKIKAKDSSIAAAVVHHGNCSNQCGWGQGDCWVYRFVDLAELSELMLKVDSDLIVGDSPSEPAPPAKRGGGRKSKTDKMVVAKETGVTVIVESFLPDDPLDVLDRDNADDEDLDDLL